MLNSPSTFNLTALPSINDLRRISKSIAVLDCIIEPDWEFRYYSFNSKWDSAEEMASMRDGSGDSYLILFTSAGAFIKGFAHESPIGRSAVLTGKTWLGIYDDVPDEFKQALLEPAFLIDEVSFCVWRRVTDISWSMGNIQFPRENDPDGSKHLLSIFDGEPETYKEWADGYYEKGLDLRSIRKIYQHSPLTNNLIKKLNNKIGLTDILDDIEEIGYPIAKNKK